MFIRNETYIENLYIQNISESVFVKGRSGLFSAITIQYFTDGKCTAWQADERFSGGNGFLMKRKIKNVLQAMEY